MVGSPQMDAGELVGWNLRRLRVRQALSQENLAVDAGLDRAYVGRLERGRENPTVGVLQKLTNAMGVPLADLFRVPSRAEKPPAPLRSGRKASGNRSSRKR
jgi:transcriptional regulator with XRE-family HTH domain